jgi:ribosomal protein L40E
MVPGVFAADGCGEGTVLVDGVCQLAPEESNDGCGEGTVLVDGVCQLAKTSGTSMSIEPLYIVIGVVAIGGIIGAIAVARRGSKTSKPAKQDLEEYEEKYLAKEKPAKQKPAEKKETSSSCSNCGALLKPTAKFCGQCGTPRS